MGQKSVNPIHYIIVLLLCFGFRFLPPFAGITPYGMAILGAFIGGIYGWIFIDLAWSSLMAITATALVAGWDVVMPACFGSEAFITLFTAMLAIGPAIHYGAFTWLAMKIMTSKALEGKGFLIIFSIFIVGWLLSSANSFIIAIIVFSFVTEMFKKAGVQENSKLAIFTYLGVSYQVMRGQILFPFIGTGVVYVNAYKMAMPDAPLPVLPYMAMMFVMGIVMAAIYVLLMKYVFRVDASPLSNFRQEGGVAPCTRDQKIALAFFVLFIVLNILANAGPLKGFLGKFGLLGITFVLGCILTMMKNNKGEPFTNQEKMMHMSNLSMGVMVGYIMFLARYLVTPETGIGAAVAALFQPFVTLPPIVFIVVVMVIALVITNLANNMMVAVVCLPFLINFTAMIGMPPMAAVVMMFIITEFALVTPAGSPITAMAMAQELVTTKEMVKAAIPMVLILFVCFLIIGWPLANLIF